MTWLAESPYLLVFASGLLGSFGHCLGMCGPLVAAFSLPLRERRLDRSNLLYHLGRVTTYSLLGGVTGLTGSFVDVAARVGWLQKTVMTGTGVLIILAGFAVGGWLPAADSLRREAGRGRIAGRMIRLVTEDGSTGAFFPLGLALGFLPCGLVYAALLSSAREGMEAASLSGGFFRGLLLMALFGAGTTPALLLVGKTAGFLGPNLRARLHRVSALLMIAVGILFSARGWMW